MTPQRMPCETAPSMASPIAAPLFRKATNPGERTRRGRCKKSCINNAKSVSRPAANATDWRVCNGVVINRPRGADHVIGGMCRSGGCFGERWSAEAASRRFSHKGNWRDAAGPPEGTDARETGGGGRHRAAGRWIQTGGLSRDAPCGRPSQSFRRQAFQKVSGCARTCKRRGSMKRRGVWNATRRL